MNPTLTLDQDTVRLSESARATLSVEGDAPLRVVLPKEPLADESAAVWWARPVGGPVTEALPGGKERWSLTYRVDPFAPGDALPLTFAPAQVTAGTAAQPTEVAWPTKTVRVVTGVKGDVATEARPVTGIEELPPAPTNGVAIAAWVGVALLVVTAAAVVAVRRRQRALPAPTALEQASAEFDAIADPMVPDDAFATRLTAALRVYIERTTDVPATTFTTSELLAAVGRTGELRPVFAGCDAVKFAGSPLPAADRAAMIEAARRFIAPEPPPCPDPPAAPS